MVSRGWAESDSSVLQARGRVGSNLVILNRLGLISKQRTDGTMKHQLAWDL